MTDLLVFGSSSLVGSHFVLTTSHRVTDMGQLDPRDEKLPVVRFAPIDLTDTPRVEEAVRRSEAEVVVNFAAATDVDAVERERPRSPEGPQGPAFLINAAAPEAMARATRETGKFLISLSTDFVFDGADGPYSEDAEPMPFSDRKSTRLNSSHITISYAVFCLKKKKKKNNHSLNKKKKKNKERHIKK